MSKFFDTLYSGVSYLGVFPKKLIISFFKSIIGFLGSFFKKKSKSAEKRADKRKFAERAIIAVVIVAVISVSVLALSSGEKKVSAIELKIGKETIGYANSQTEVDTAKAYALKVLGSSNSVQIKEASVKTEANNIKNAASLSENIIKLSGADLISVYEVYISDTLLCAVTDITQARKAVKEVYELTQKLYPQSAVAFSKRVSFVPTQYAQDNANILSVGELKNILGSALQFIHASCEENISQTQFETVEVQTNNLFIGDTRVRREGANGTQYNINLVKYIGNQKILSEQLLSHPINAPVTKIVERGTRAQSLSMGTYTVYQTSGVFCWPVVDLYKVTSPFGQRRLGNHKGIDISGANASGKLIVAGASGTVIKAGWNNGGYGNYVVIDHGNGVETLYAHMLNNSIMVNVGDVVQRGQTIGRVGNTGNSFGAHLHFEVRINGIKLNPAPFLGLQ